jgi:hypothetical protein
MYPLCTLSIITRRVMQQTIARRRIGWFDYSSDSFDMRVVNARALRIYLRQHGERITLRRAMWGD